MGPERTVHDPPLLYHLGDDPGERFDVAEDHPGVLQDLIDEANRYRERVDVETVFVRPASPGRIAPVGKTPRFYGAPA